MSVSDERPDEEDGLDQSQKKGDRNRPRRLVVAGAAALAVVAGLSGALVANHDDETTSQELNAVAPVIVEPSETGAAATSAPVASLTPSPGPTPSRTAARPAAKQSAAAASKATKEPARKTTTEPARKTTKEPARDVTKKPADKVRKDIEEARAKAARDGHALQRPLSVAPQAAAAEVTEETRALPGGGTMRVISAKGDLSGRREMLWAADDGKKVGEADCTRTFRFSRDEPGRVRPTMLLCWRISGKRSVVVLSVTRQGSPSAKQAVKVLNTRWNRLS